MLALRNTSLKTLAAKSAPATKFTLASHNVIARRFKSDNAALADEESRPASDTLMNIITSSINSPGSGLANEAFRAPRGTFRRGDIYKPSDLNDSKPITYANPPKPVDELKILKLNPVVEYKNATLLSHYITPLGRLMSREQTGLSAKNQRRLTKAVRRARAMCILSPTAKLD